MLLAVQPYEKPSFSSYMKFIRQKSHKTRQTANLTKIIEGISTVRFLKTTIKYPENKIIAPIFLQHISKIQRINEIYS